MTTGVAVPDGRSWGNGVTARLIPQEPVYASFSERRFATSLREQLPEDAVLFANQRFTDRDGDREADLILLWPGHGIAVIEVKGGLIHLVDGQWRQPWSNPKGWKPIDPVEQARKVKYALRDYLHQHPRWSRGNPRLIHMVALPATQLDEDFHTPDAPRWLVMDRTDTPHAADRIASALRLVQGQPPPPTHDDVARIVECVAGAAIPQRELLTRLREREDACELLSEDQGRVLDMVSSHRRVEIRGGAGSGKTWLAVEKARRLARSGKRVALMCYSRGLAEFLSRRVAGLARSQRPAYVGTFHSLGIGWGVLPGSDDDSAYWEQQLPQLMVSMAADRPFIDRFDAIVVDEGQDFAQSWWPAVIAALRDREGGELYVFSDEHQRVFARQGSPPVPLTAFDLNENLRNTKQIAQTFSSLTPSIQRTRGGNGVPVGFIQCAPEDAMEAGDDAIVALEKAGWPAETLALLTTHSRHPVQVEQQAEGQEAYWATFWDGEWPFYGHVLGFKGLERPAVVLVVNGFRDEARAREMLYVGLSRARDLLVVCGDIEMIRRVGGDGVANRLTKPGPAAARA